MLHALTRGLRQSASRAPPAASIRSRALSELKCMSRYSNIDEAVQRYPLTKMVCTIGPVSEDAKTLQSLVTEGLRVMRINFSHATFEEATLRMKNLRNSKGFHGGAFNMRSVMLDTQGPEIRTGKLEGDPNERKRKVQLTMGDMITLTTNPEYREKGNKDMLWISYENLCQSVEVGSSILFDDGLIELVVTDIGSDTVTCKIMNSGLLGEKKGVNLPGASVDLPALTEKDKTDIRFGIENDIDFIAASFVRTGKCVKEIKAFVEEVHAEFWPESHPVPGIISKIENQEALRNIDSIIDESYGIMVARGDLGVEIPYENVTLAQKEMIYRCQKIGKPVIVATQMLESMQGNPRPTRAEVSDVTNAVIDGADCVMLSGESANGKYPLESVKALGSIAVQADKHVAFTQGKSVAETYMSTEDMTNIEALAYSAVRACEEIKAACIIVMTSTGKTAKFLSKFRPSVPIMAYVDNAKIGRQLIMHRGVHPLLFKRKEGGDSPDIAVQRAIEFGFCKEGDNVLVLQSMMNNGVFDVAMRIRKVGETSDSSVVL
mmetsp:Transcript_11390/g.22915  ORF Transcript_11390/g.22915 Transcript_11390/m.22915 type:complete len:547 (+) Transcript_11390:3-1643(+)